nr:hypothetical protein [Tanacetum cinerariifolium]
SVGKEGKEVFGMPIPDALLTDAIKGAPYYCKYLACINEYQRYLDEEHGKAKEEEVPESLKATKRKLVKETPDAPSPAKQSKPGKVTTKRKLMSPLKLVDEFVDEGVPERSWVLAHPMVFRETDSGRFQPLLEVQGKGKEKVVDEQAARGLLTLQTLKRKSPSDQVIFQRCTFMTTGSFGNNKSPSLDVELDLADSEMESDVPDISIAKDTKMEVTHTETLVTTSGVPDEGKGGSDIGKGEEMIKIAEAEHTTEEQIREEFTSTMYPNVQDNLKLQVEEQVILEEHASSTGTLSSLPHLDKDFNFSDQFLNDKSSDAEKENTHAEAEVESMVISPFNKTLPLSLQCNSSNTSSNHNNNNNSNNNHNNNPSTTTTSTTTKHHIFELSTTHK